MRRRTKGSRRCMKPRIISNTFLFVISLLAAFSVCSAQESPKPESSGPVASTRTASSLQQDSERGKGFHLGVNVDLVLMYTSVFDKDGRFVSGLEENKFKIYEDGIEQTIASFSQEDVPVSMGIVIDLSGSMRGKIEQVNKAALAFIQASNREDQVFLIGFNDEAELLQDFSSDIDEIKDALDNTVVTGGTVLYDAIYLGVQKAHTGTKVKKAIVVITDGEDKDSFYKLDELVAKVQESDVQVFCVGFLEDMPKKNIFGRWSNAGSKKAFDALTRISEETGGKAFFPREISEIHGIVAEIASELRSQYSIGYFSSNTARDGTFRRVKISLANPGTGDIHLRYRRGYFAPKAEGVRQPESAPVRRSEKNSD